MKIHSKAPINMKQVLIRDVTTNGPHAILAQMWREFIRKSGKLDVLELFIIKYLRENKDTTKTKGAIKKMMLAEELSFKGYCFLIADVMQTPGVAFSLSASDLEVKINVT